VCCSDHVHCCPTGYTCDVSAGTCSKGHLVQMWEKKTEAKQIVPEVRDVVCPGGDSSCPDGSTCCQLASGQFGCCPQPKAVCCSDHVHCCPTGYTCDVSAGTCSKGHLAMPWSLKTLAFPRVQEKALDAEVQQEKKHALKAFPSFVQYIRCPGGKSQCPDGATCCELKTGKFGCCPVAQAECCSDGVHCCPKNYVCHDFSGTCQHKGGKKSITWLEKQEAIVIEEEGF